MFKIGIVIAPSPRARHSEGRIMDLSYMTLKTEVPCRSRCKHVKEPSLLKAVSAEHRSKFAALSPVMVQIAEKLLMQFKTNISADVS
jgi:hypothetical protein